MCGIAGILNFNKASVDQGVIRRMTDMIAHRGPDSEGCWVDGCIGLGHRRLSIIDLSDDGRQPMKSSESGAVITYNGEIYNYRELSKQIRSRGVDLQTQTDTEVILKLYEIYGVACLKYLRGMFAFAIWDPRKRELFVARDRVGIKPLYYLSSHESFVFGSEIKAVAASGHSSLQLSTAALAGLMRFLVVPQPDTILKDIVKLDPASYMLISANGDIRKNTYWNILDHMQTDEHSSEKDFIAGLDERLNESIRYHMIADVPVSAFLSGGLDSSAVVALMRENNQNLNIATFSTIFPGLPEYDEDVYARKVASAKSTIHSANEFHEGFIADYEKIIWHLDEPFAVSSAYASYYLASGAAEKTKVVLTGDGGDELFGGYSGYKNDAYLAAGGCLRPVLSGIFGALFAYESNFGSGNKNIYRMLTGLGRRIGTEGVRYSEQIAQNSFHALGIVASKEFFKICMESWSQNLVAKYYDDVASKDRLCRKLYAEFKTRLVDEMLMKVDRMTMAHSLEARVPLLDNAVIEYAFRIPSHLKLHKSSASIETKYILKKTMERYLPEDIIYRKKQGFNIPVRSWMQGVLGDNVCDRLQDGLLVKHGMMRSDGVRKLLGLHRQGAGNYQNMLMLLLALETWMQVYIDRIGQVKYG